MRFSPTPLLLLLPLALACTPVHSDPATLPLPDVTLEQCGPAPEAGAIYLEGQVTQRPKLRKVGRIDYPRHLRAQDVSGVVRFALVIDTAGKPVESSLQTLEATDSGFVGPARRMVLTSQFIPGVLEGHPVAVCTAQRIHFN